MIARARNRIPPAFLLATTLAVLAAAGCGPSGPAEVVEEVPGQSQQELVVDARIRSGVADGRCLDVSNGVAAQGVNVQIWPCNSSNAQKWTRTASGQLQSSVGSNLCLDVSGGGAVSGTNVQIWPCNGSNAQKWTQTTAGELRSAVGTNLCLDVDGPTGTNVQIWTCLGGSNQKWFAEI